MRFDPLKTVTGNASNDTITDPPDPPTPPPTGSWELDIPDETLNPDDTCNAGTWIPTTPIIAHEPATIAGGTNIRVSVDGFVQALPTTIALNALVEIELFAPLVYEEEQTWIVDINGDTYTTSCTTQEDPTPPIPDDTTPDDFFFIDIFASLGGETVTSEEITIAGLGYGVVVTADVTGLGAPQISVNGGPWTGEADVENGDRVRVRSTAPLLGLIDFLTVTIGDTSSSFNIFGPISLPPLWPL